MTATVLAHAAALRPSAALLPVTRRLHDDATRDAVRLAAALANELDSELASLDDDDLRLERAAEAIRAALRGGALADIRAAARAALPTQQPLPARHSVLTLLAQAQPTPMCVPDEGQLFVWRRLNGAPIGLLRLRHDGQVSRSGLSAQALAPAHWRRSGGGLELLDGQGRCVSQLGLAGRSTAAAGRADGAQLLYVGESQKDGTLHVLSEVACTYSRMRMLDPELVAPFGSLFGSDALAEVALPQRPVVVLATPHCAATRLQKLLNSSADVLIDGELLHPQRIALADADLAADDAGALPALRAADPVYFTRVMLGRSHHLDGRSLDAVPVRGLLLNPAHSRAVLDWAIDDPALTIIHLARENLLAEYAAILGGNADDAPRTRLHFDADRFVRFVALRQRSLNELRQRVHARSGAWAELEASALNQGNLDTLLQFLAPTAKAVAWPTGALTCERSGPTIDHFDNPEAVTAVLAALDRAHWAQG